MKVFHCVIVNMENSLPKAEAYRSSNTWKENTLGILNYTEKTQGVPGLKTVRLVMQASKVHPMSLPNTNQIYPYQKWTKRWVYFKATVKRGKVNMEILH